jgi:Predicted membrane protein
VRYALLLAIPLAVVAAYLALKPAGQADTPAVATGEVPASAPAAEPQPADEQSAVPEAAQSASKPAAPAPVVAAVAPSPAPVAQAPANATVSLAITPWGEVYVDGQKAGISPPLTRLEIEPGRHDIEIRNGTFATHHVKVDLDAEESLKIKHKFK